MGFAVEDNNFIYCDNQSVMMNASLTDSTLKKKSNSIVYHFFHKGIEKYEWRCGKVGTYDNSSYLMNKYSIFGNNIIRNVSTLMYGIW